MRTLSQQTARVLSDFVPSIWVILAKQLGILHLVIHGVISAGYSLHLGLETHPASSITAPPDVRATNTTGV